MNIQPFVIVCILQDSRKHSYKRQRFSKRKNRERKDKKNQQNRWHFSIHWLSPLIPFIYVPGPNDTI